MAKTKKKPTEIEDGRGFRKVDMTARIQIEPKKAREEIAAAYRVAGASLKHAAKVLGVAERTLHRWVDALEMRPALEKMTKAALAEGWMCKTRRRRPAMAKTEAS